MLLPRTLKRKVKPMNSNDYPEEYAKYFEHHHEHGLTYHDEEKPPKHAHIHSAEHKKVVLNRLSKAIGHLESVKRMVEDDKDCMEVLMQLTAVRNAVTNLGKLILKEHTEHCIVDAVSNHDESAIDDIKKALDYFIK